MRLGRNTRTRIDPADPRDLIPHFTVALWCELRRRIETRILEDLVGPTMLPGVARRDNIYDPRTWASSIALELTARIYRTQLKEARTMLSVTDETLKYNEFLETRKKLLAPAPV